MLIKERRQNDGTNPSQRSSDLLQSSPHDNLPTSVNEVGFVTESIEAMKLSKRAGSSIANLSTGLDMMRDSSIEVTEENHDALQEAKVDRETGGSNRAAHIGYFAQPNLSNYVFRFSHRDRFSRSLLRRTFS